MMGEKNIEARVTFTRKGDKKFILHEEEKSLCKFFELGEKLKRKYFLILI